MAICNSEDSLAYPFLDQYGFTIDAYPVQSASSLIALPMEHVQQEPQRDVGAVVAFIDLQLKRAHCQ